MNNRRVVVTGIGLITPLGRGCNINWNNVLNGKSCIKALHEDGYIIK